MLSLFTELPFSFVIMFNNLLYYTDYAQFLLFLLRSETYYVGEQDVYLHFDEGPRSWNNYRAPWLLPLNPWTAVSKY